MEVEVYDVGLQQFHEFVHGRITNTVPSGFFPAVGDYLLIHTSVSFAQFWYMSFMDWYPTKQVALESLERYERDCLARTMIDGGFADCFEIWHVVSDEVLQAWQSCVDDAEQLREVRESLRQLRIAGRLDLPPVGDAIWNACLGGLIKHPNCKFLDCCDDRNAFHEDLCVLRKYLCDYCSAASPDDCIPF